MNPLIILSILFSSFITICKADRDNLQDSCPAAPGKQTIFFNGLPCKNPADISAPDFKTSKVAHPGDTDNFLQSSVTMVTAAEFPGLNTLGLSIGRTDLEVSGIVMPHSHPRASEMIFINKGLVIAGFVDTQNQLFQKVLHEGDVFVFPRGLLHFCLNGGYEFATAYSVHNSQNPGVVSISDANFDPDQNYIKHLLRRIQLSLSTEEANGLGNFSLAGFSRIYSN
ncbi:germin-like protein subfamily 3 member 4 [Carica papaya]|uniref:germin-like protein subfamily 3 member 4 n=1 Tax=Carica papaya TaxID=3649 RepID=UPI000B8CD216|nr:germin-like protein subfamily 3 member 4 [Carica papaya]